MEKSELTVFGGGLKERLKEFFTKEGFEKTEINLEFNSNDDYGNRIVKVSITASTTPYVNKKT